VSLLGVCVQAYAANSYNDVVSYVNENEKELNAIPANMVWEHPVYTDEEYRTRLASIKTTIPISYNSGIRNFIHVYTIKKRDLSERVLGHKDIYFPIFEALLKKYNMPDELKYLAITESALNTNIVSRAGATGLWQLMPGTARELGLTVNSYLDESRDPYIATDAALRYLKRLYRKYGDWLLVIAAYNCGPGNVNKAIRRSGGRRTFWSIKQYLPRETRSYVPSFIACVYWVNFSDYHHLSTVMPVYHDSHAYSDAVMVRGSMSLQSVAERTGTSLEELVWLNPALRRKVTVENKTYALRLTSRAIDTFKTSDYGHYVQMGVSLPDYAVNPNPMMAGMNRPSTVRSLGVSSDVQVLFNYTVKQGDNLKLIADWYDCSLDDVKKWNNLQDEMGYTVNSTLKIFVPQQLMSQYEYVNVMTYEEKQGLNDRFRRQTVLSKYGVGNLSTSHVASNTHRPNTTTSYTSQPVQYGVSGTPTNNANRTIPVTKAVYTSNITPDNGTVAREALLYKVKKGDNLTRIASWYNCSADDIKEWNGMSRTTLSTGQDLVVFVNRNDVTKYSNINSLSFSQKEIKYGNGTAVASNTVNYTVRRGDTLSGIAAKYGCGVSDLKRWNNLYSTRLQVGQKLKIKG